MTKPDSFADQPGHRGGDHYADRFFGGWSRKPVRWLTIDELAEALQFMERHRRYDDALARALAGEFARRTAVPS